MKKNRKKKHVSKLWIPKALIYATFTLVSIPFALLYMASQNYLGLAWTVLVALFFGALTYTSIRKNDTSWRDVGFAGLGGSTCIVFYLLPSIINTPQGILWAVGLVVFIGGVVLASFWNDITLWWDTRK